MDRSRPGKTWFIRVLPITLLFLLISLLPVGKVFASPPAQTHTPTALEVIEAVNALRVSRGLAPLAMHSALMQAAQAEANGIASGAPGHWRPEGLTLGQWLISLGYPLAGDLKLDGFRSENWAMAESAEEAVQAWLGDDIHTNTMLSQYRSDIGVGIAVGEDVIIVLTTALQTNDGRMQPTAAPLLTQMASLPGGTLEEIRVSQYLAPVVLSTARPDGDVVHKVQHGQSLWSIAIAYQTTIDQINRLNNLGQDTTIYEGWLLLVQKGATQPVPATATPGETSTPQPSATLQQAADAATATALPTALGTDAEPAPRGPSQEQVVKLILAVLALGGSLSLITIIKPK
jgi:uncharacterized protein YkwD